MLERLVRSGGGPQRPDAAAILRETEQILASAAFRSSRRSQEVLRYLVDHALNGDTEALKERVIGQEVFGRPFDYDTGQYSIVRGKVNEVRKRLAQYFDEAGGAAAVRIEIPVGSYVPEFHTISPAAPAPPGTSRRPILLSAVITAVVVGLLALAAYFGAGREPSPFDAFWQPFLESPKNVMLCVAHPRVYNIYGSEVDDLVVSYRGQTAQRASGYPAPRRLDVVIIPDAHNFVGVGDAYAIGQLFGLFKARNKSPQIRRGNDMSFAELRSAPSVLIGGFSNQWSLSLLNELRYVPDSTPPGLRIHDRKEGKQIAALAPFRDGLPHTYVDYAIISRLVRSRTGEALLGVVGISHYGTMAAAELVADSAAWSSTLAEVSGWSAAKNLQVVLRVNVIMRAPEKPEVIASHVW